MKRTVLVGASLLTLILYAVGYAVQFAIAFLTISFDLPAPNSDSPIVWVWLALGIVVAFGMSLGFCHWFAKRIERKVRREGTFK